MTTQTLLPYVLALIINNNQEVLLEFRTNCTWFSDYYGLPGGKINDQETPRQALARELSEELGITCDPEHDLEFVHVMPFMGQTRPCVAFVFKVLRWKGTISNKEPHKSAELIWSPVTQLPETIIPRHKIMLESIFKNNVYSEQSIH